METEKTVLNRLKNLNFIHKLQKLHYGSYNRVFNIFDKSKNII